MNLIIDKSKTVSFSGHRTEKLKCDIKILERKLVFIINELIQKGYDTFITGGCYGFDLIVFGILNRAKTKYPHIKSIIALPFIGQEKFWEEKNKDLYKFALEHSDYVHYISQTYKKGVYHTRNRYMVDNSSILVCYSNGTGGSEYTLNYAKKSGIGTINLYNKI